MEIDLNAKIDIDIICYECERELEVVVYRKPYSHKQEISIHPCKECKDFTLQNLKNLESI